MVTPEKQRQKLGGQSAYAQKIFQFVPIAEAWTANAIASEMQRVTGSRPDVRTLWSCLQTMAEAGLVRVSTVDLFQRTPVSTPSIKPKDVSEMKTAPQATSATPASVSAIDVLGGLAARLRGLAQELDSAALAIEESQATAAADMAKFKQFQALLKDLG